MLNLRPSVGSLKAQIEALRTQILTLSDDPEAIAELNARLLSLQQAADALPATQQAVSNLQAAIEQALRQEHIDNMATTEDMARLQALLDAIHIPDVSSFTTHQQLVEQGNQILDLTGSEIADAESRIISRIPDTTNLASKDAVTALAAKIPDTTNLATKDAVTALSNRIPDVTGLASTTSVTALSDQVKAIKVPAAATQPPPKTDLVEEVGTSAKYAREDHTHKARIKRATVTIGQDGYATWTFTEPFASVPVISHMVQDAKGASRVNVTIISVSTTSVVVYADRLRTLPVINAVSGLLGAVITGVNSLVTALSGFDLSGGPAATGVKVHLMAAEVTV